MGLGGMHSLRASGCGLGSPRIEEEASYSPGSNNPLAATPVCCFALHHHDHSHSLDYFCMCASQVGVCQYAFTSQYMSATCSAGYSVTLLIVAAILNMVGLGLWVLGWAMVKEWSGCLAKKQQSQTAPSLQSIEIATAHPVAQKSYT